MNPSTTANKETLYVLYGSRTGNSQAAAKLAHEYAVFLGLKSELINMQECEPEIIFTFKNLLIAVSTHGEGDPPLAAENLLSALSNATGPRMRQARFSVLALGDSSYRHYCKTGRDFQENLLKLGAKKIFDLQECDIDFEEGAKHWIEGAVNAFREVLPSSGTGTRQQFVFELDPTGQAIGDLYMAKILDKRILNPDNPLRQTMHLTLSLKNSGITYLPGDSIGITSFNSRMVVDELIRSKGYDPTHIIPGKETREMLKQALINDYEITLLTPVVVRKYADLAKGPKLETLLKDKKALETYCETRDVFDLVSDYPADLPVSEFITILRKLTPRLYSVAGSPLKDPDIVELLVSIVAIRREDRFYEGVCSSFLSVRTEKGESVGIHLEVNEKFRLPSPGVPVIMIGAGTGLAPFRAFLQERQAVNAPGRNWLFFGEQYRKTDFFFQEELEGYEKSGLLTRLDTAFSRDQAEKIYVTRRMMENSHEFFRWINEGAVIYLSGNKRKLAPAVRQAIHTILKTEGRMSVKEASDFFSRMKSERRFVEDVY